MTGASTDTRRSTAVLYWQRSCATCAASKSFLAAAGIAFDSVDIGSEAGRARWEAAGRPGLPAVTTGEVTTSISTIAQLASAVGVAPPPGAPVGREAGECLALMDAWLAHVRVFGWELLSAPSPSRGRTLRELTVNVFSQFEFVPSAWESGELRKHPDADDVRGAAFASRDELTDWAAGIARDWAHFLAVNETELDDPARRLVSSRGALQWGPFVSAKRWHTAFHYRQLVAFAEREGVARPAGVLELASLRDLELPPEVF
jgi:hypothetical protein